MSIKRTFIPGPLSSIILLIYCLIARMTFIFQTDKFSIFFFLKQEVDRHCVIVKSKLDETDSELLNYDHLDNSDHFWDNSDQLWNNSDHFSRQLGPLFNINFHFFLCNYNRTICLPGGIWRLKIIFYSMAKIIKKLQGLLFICCIFLFSMKSECQLVVRVVFWKVIRIVLIIY